MGSWEAELTDIDAPAAPAPAPAPVALALLWAPHAHTRPLTHTLPNLEPLLPKFTLLSELPKTARDTIPDRLPPGRLPCSPHIVP
jgi:hypothetical protein